MILGITGAHRSGKTTLAKAYADTFSEWTFEPHQTLQATSHNIVGVLPLEERMEAQQELLSYHKQFIYDLNRSGGKVILDRTPLDLATYLLCEIPMTAQNMPEVVSYVDDCLTLANESFAQIVMLNPLEHYVEQEGKPPLNPGYHRHFVYTLSGIFHDANLTIRKNHILKLGLANRVQTLRSFELYMDQKPE